MMCPWIKTTQVSQGIVRVTGHTSFQKKLQSRSTSKSYSLKKDRLINIFVSRKVEDAWMWLLDKAVHKLHPGKTSVLALAFSVDTSRHKPAEDHEMAFWCMLVYIGLRFAFPTMPKKSDPQAGDPYLIRDLRIEQSIQGLSLKYEKFTFLCFSLPHLPSQVMYFLTQ